MSQQRRKTLLILGLLLLIGMVRIWHLGEIPAALNRDEAALAYNGLLIAESGKDEWGRAWPTTFESFGDFKLPGYPYLLSVVWKFAQPSDFLVRLPSALAGIALLPAVFFLTLHLWHSQRIALVSTSLVALAPVFFFYSQFAYEANIALTCMVGALALFTRSKPRAKADVLAVGVWIIGMLFYNTPLILLPFLLLFIIFWRGPQHTKRWIFPSALLVISGSLVAIAVIPATMQKTNITIFSDPTLISLYPEYRATFSGISQSLFGNSFAYFSTLLLPRILSSLSSGFLVVQGGSHPWHTIPGWSHLTWPIYIAGFLGVVSSAFTAIYSFNESKKLSSIVEFFKRIFSDGLSAHESARSITSFYWLIAALAPAVITVDAPHATRSLLFFVFFCMFGAVGLEKIATIFQQHVLKAKNVSKSIILALLLVCLVPFVGFLHSFRTEYPSHSTSLFRPGLATVLARTEATPTSQTYALIDNEGYQYISVAWYAKIHAEEFLTTVSRNPKNTIGFSYVNRLGKYIFLPESSEEVRGYDQIEWTGDEWQVIQP